jgi:hypothetical protein
MPLQPGSSEATQQSNLKEVYKSYKRTGKIGNSRPKNKRKALKQAIAIAIQNAKRSSRGKNKNK